MAILDQFSLAGKVALVTGATRGLGQGIAIGYAEAGADVVGVGSAEQAPDTQAAIEATGRRYIHKQVNLLEASVEDLQNLVESVVAEFGQLDILVNNAGIVRRAPIWEYSEADWDAVLQINLKAAFFLAQAAAKAMKDQPDGGKIINIASLLSYQGGITVPSYTASKHGIMGLTRALGNELAPHNIQVNAIAPGYMATDITTALREDEERNAAILARIPAGRWGNLDDLRGAAILLASRASDYMSGTTIDVDGGWMAR